MRVRTALAVFLPLVLAACEGPVGPEGPPGPPGAVGVTSATFTVTAPNATSTETVVAVSRTMPAITADVLDRGLVLAYLNLAGAWVPLPFTIPSSNVVTVTPAYTPGQVGFLFQSTNRGTAFSGLGAFQFRVVAVPAGTVTANQARVLKAAPYAEVEARLGLR